MRAITIALIVSLLALGTGDAFAQSEATDWREVSEAIPLGSKVKIQTVEGKRYSGTLMRVDSNGVMVKRNTRNPEPAIAIPFESMSKIEREKDGGFNLAKAIAVGAATGAGAMLTLILFAMHWD